MSRYKIGETEAFLDGDVIPDADFLDMYPVVEWRVANWREARFGIEQPPDLPFLIDRTLFSGYHIIGVHDRLPHGNERSWARGIWVPVAWR
jgi:hypothetical protein